MAKDPRQLPPNTYDMLLNARITIPEGQTPEDQDHAMLITGENFEPWPGVLIHDVHFVSAEPARADAAHV